MHIQQYRVMLMVIKESFLSSAVATYIGQNFGKLNDAHTHIHLMSLALWRWLVTQRFMFMFCDHHGRRPMSVYFHTHHVGN